MKVGLRAIFREYDKAESAKTEIDKKYDVFNIDLLTRKNIDEFVNERREESFAMGALKAAGAGAFIGLVLGFIVTFLIKGSLFEVGFLLPLLVFVIGGTFAGIVYSTAIFFISKEKWATISKNDLTSGDDAILLIRTKRKFMKDIEQYLNSHGAEKVHRG